MIIFSTIDINYEMVQYCGGIKTSKAIKYNLTSMNNVYPTLQWLLPYNMGIPQEVIEGDCDSDTFDYWYWRMIEQKPNSFLDLMRIMIPVFNDPTLVVQIGIDESSYRNSIRESLIKYIQRRYGVVSYIVTTPEDFILINSDDTTFSIPGLFNMDEDLKRWISISPPELKEEVEMLNESF